MIERIKRLVHFFTVGIFERRESSFRGPTRRWFVRQYKLLFYTIRGMLAHDTLVRSASLTFYTIMSIVPIVALVFAIVKGFGLSEMMTSGLHRLLPQFPEFVDYIVRFADNALERTRGGIVATVGIAVLFWAVVRVFSNVENAFNNIWEVKRRRSVARQFSDYVAVVVIAPLLWLLSNAAVLGVSDLLHLQDTVLYRVLSNAVSVVLIWIMFVFVYMVVPDTRVRFTSALTAGMIAGTAFLLFQWGYFYLQRWMSSYNAIYGSFAALPLFLIWMQISWEILLVGGELAFAYQNIDRFEQERRAADVSAETLRRILLAVMLTVVRDFVDSKGPLSSEQIAERLKLPLRIVRDVVFELEQAGLLVAVREERNERVNRYLPARDVHRLTLYDVLVAVEDYGSSPIDIECPDLVRIGKLLDRVKADAFRSPLNTRLIDL